ncbi:hypothetical protein C8F01DRAFT_1091792 [Mycena amicta]|nr:hypothetical protein C8F01DRAFT_1091792 [Mycena amicta]
MPSSLNMNYLLDPASEIVTTSASAGQFEHLPTFSMLLLQLAHDAQVDLPQSSMRHVTTPPPMVRSKAVIPPGRNIECPLMERSSPTFCNIEIRVLTFVPWFTPESILVSEFSRLSAATTH